VPLHRSPDLLPQRSDLMLVAHRGANDVEPHRPPRDDRFRVSRRATCAAVAANLRAWAAAIHQVPLSPSDTLVSAWMCSVPAEGEHLMNRGIPPHGGLALAMGGGLLLQPVAGPMPTPTPPPTTPLLLVPATVATPLH